MAPLSSRVITTGVSPMKVALKSPALGTSAARPMKFQVGPRNILACSSSYTACSVNTPYGTAELTPSSGQMSPPVRFTRASMTDYSFGAGSDGGDHQGVSKTHSFSLKRSAPLTRTILSTYLPVL